MQNESEVMQTQFPINVTSYALVDDGRSLKSLNGLLPTATGQAIPAPKFKTKGMSRRIIMFPVRLPGKSHVKVR